jgi:hypothetical protein
MCLWGTMHIRSVGAQFVMIFEVQAVFAGVGIRCSARGILILVLCDAQQCGPLGRLS